MTLSILKFLAFEQTLKNSLTGLPMGAGKGGANFNPRGKSDHEVMRFCRSYMTELQRHIGSHVDVAAGDIGVGAREIGYMMDHMLAVRGDSLEGKTCVVSGSGNVAIYAVEKINELGGKIVTMSDSNGYIYDPDGIDPEKLAWVKDLKNVRRGRIAEYTGKFDRAAYYENERLWKVPCDLAFPCATQNEISGEDAKSLVGNGCIGVAEGANMPTMKDGVDAFIQARILFAPGKAANADAMLAHGLI